MLTFGYFLLSFGIFLIFAILLTLLGYFFQYYIFPKFKTKKISLTIILESFGVGVVLFIYYAYFIIDFLRMFNFYTIYLPLIFFNSINVFYFFYKNNYFSGGNFRNLINKFYNLLSEKRIKRHVGILFVAFSLLLMAQGVIETYLNFPSKDPYTWFEIAMYLQRYGDLNYKNYTVHGVGFAIFSAGSLLITNDFYVQYFFFKYISIFFFCIIILTIYNIASVYFKKDVEILITLIVLLSFNSLLIRFSLGVPSIIATTLAVIFFSTLIQKENSRILVIRGLLLGGMILTHPLYFLFLFTYLVLFELLLLINWLKQRRKNGYARILDNTLIFLKRNGILLIISIIITIPYLLNLYFSGKSLYKNFTRYLFRGYEADIHYFPQDLYLSLHKGAILMNLQPSRTNILYNLIYFGLNHPINKTLNWGVIFLIIGLFYNIKWKNHQKNYLVEFIKFTFILTFLIFILDSFLFVIDNVTILSLASFINQYGKRNFELFSPIWAILFVLGVKIIFEYIKQVKLKHLKNNEASNGNKITIVRRKYEKACLIFLIVAGISIYSSHIYLQYTILYTSHYEDDYLTEALLYMGEYFNSENLEDKTVLLPDNFDSKVIFRLIYHKDFEREYFEYDNTNYTILLNEMEEENADFVLVYKLEAKDSCLDEIDDKQKVLYENPNFLFFKVK